MEDWTRIGDWDFAPFGNRTICFARSDNGARYNVTVDQGDPNARNANIGGVTLTVSGQSLELFLNLKEVSSSGIYRLSGGLNDSDNLLEIDCHAWAELLLTEPARLSYWGTGVVLRSDIELGS